MSSTTPEFTGDSTKQVLGSSSNPKNTVVMPYLIAICAQLPLLFLYFRSLWIYKPHYQFIPFAVAVVLVLAWIRWPREARLPHHKSLFSDTFLILGLLAGLINCLFIEPWLAAVSCFFLATSLFARTYDSQTGKSLLALSLPLLVCIVPPKRGDMWVITKLQRISAQFTSQLLDLIGYGHNMPGTVVEAPGTDGFGIAEACSGVQSFFTLLFVAVVFAVWNRRPAFRTLLLMASAVFWAIFMNTVRIFMIPFCDRAFGLDLSSGISHALLGYATLLMGILLVFSTDQLILFLFGPVDSESSGTARGLSKMVSGGWNKFLAGVKDDSDESEKRKKRPRQKMSGLTKKLILGVAGIMLLGGLSQFVDVGRSLFTTGKKVNFFQSIITQTMERDDLPSSIDGWKLAPKNSYSSENREAGNDLGLHSDVWRYLGPRYMMTISLDQTFPGWHELCICYQNQGWKLEKRVWEKEKMQDGSDRDWSYIRAEFSNNEGERAFLVFSLFDVYGDPYAAPKNWETIDYLLSRTRNRLSQKVRAQLFRGETFQTQAFVRTAQAQKLDETQQQQIIDRYLKLREGLRVQFLKRRSGELQPSEDTTTPSSEDATVTPTP